MQQVKDYLNKEDVVCAVYHNGSVYTAGESGIKPIMQWIQETPKMLKGALIADKVVGKAAALLMVYGGVEEVYAGVISEPACEALEQNGIPFTYGKKVPNIINRAGDDICPMEKCCLEINDSKQAYEALKKKIGGK